MAYIDAVIVVVVAALDTPGVQTAPLLAVIGTAGLVIDLTLTDCRTSPRT